MKKYIILVSACLFTVSVFAQEAVEENARETKKSKEYLPAQGDVTLGINMVPFLNYFGNLMNGNLNNSFPSDKIGGVPAVPGLENCDFSIFGKYFLTEKTAVRVNLGILAHTEKDKGYATDQAALASDPLSKALVEDSWKQNTSGFSLAVGYEWRRGYKRLQGFWGGQVILGYSTTKDKYTYGNAITEANQNPEVTNAYRVPDPADNIGGNSRLLSDNKGNQFVGGIGGFTGVEYYIAPKIAIGCEVSLNLLWTKVGKAEQKSERFNDRFNGAEENTRFTSPGGSEFNFKTQNIGTSLFVAFSF